MGVPPSGSDPTWDGQEWAAQGSGRLQREHVARALQSDSPTPTPSQVRTPPGSQQGITWCFWGTQGGQSYSGWGGKVDGGSRQLLCQGGLPLRTHLHGPHLSPHHGNFQNVMLSGFNPTLRSQLLKMLRYSGAQPNIPVCLQVEYSFGHWWLFWKPAFSLVFTRVKRHFIMKSNLNVCASG